MASIVLYVQITYSTILRFINASNAREEKFMIRIEWFVPVQLIILSKLLLDVFLAIYQIISQLKLNLVCHARKILFLLQVQVDAYNVLLIPQFSTKPNAYNAQPTHSSTSKNHSVNAAALTEITTKQQANANAQPNPPSSTAQTA